jgi:D-arabinose 1-dehydrogenase-like Zn-dependent alcohol dehydrogenase
MRAIVLRQIGGPEVLEWTDAPDPVPGAGEVLVRVKAEGVCGRDLIDRRGGFRGLKLPVILGHEFAGEVVKVSAGVTDLAPGDRVANLLRLGCGACRSCLRGETPICERAWQSFGQTRDGGYAEFVVAPAAALVKIPAQVSDVEAASVACTFGVALRALRTVAKATLGDRVLVTGASGGVGMAAIQVAKALGADVIAVTSSESKHEALAKAGADDVIVHADSQKPLHDLVRERAPLGVDVALELTGSPTFSASLRSLKNGGRLALVGNILADSIKFNPGAVILYGYQILGSAGSTRTDLDDAFAMIAAKKLTVYINQVLPLEKAAEAHRLLADRAAIGRIILTP